MQRTPYKHPFKALYRTVFHDQVNPYTKKQNHKYVYTIVIPPNSKKPKYMRHFFKMFKNFRQLILDTLTDTFQIELSRYLKSLKTLKILELTRDDAIIATKLYKSLPLLTAFKTKTKNDCLSKIGRIRTVQKLILALNDNVFFRPKMESFYKAFRRLKVLKDCRLDLSVISLKDLTLNFMEKIPQIQSYQLRFMELNIPKGVDDLDASIYQKLEGLSIQSVTKNFMLFFEKHINHFSNIKELALSRNNPTIINVKHYIENMNIFSCYQNLKNLNKLGLYFKLDQLTPEQVKNFFMKLKLPNKLQKFSLSINKIIVNEGDQIENEVAQMLNQLKLSQDLRSVKLHFTINENPQFWNKVFNKLEKNYPSLQSFIFNNYSHFEGQYSLIEIFKWVASHRFMNYLNLEFPQKDFSGFSENLQLAQSLRYLGSFHLVSEKYDLYDPVNTVEFLKFIAQIQSLRSLHLNFWHKDMEADALVAIREQILKLPNLHEVILYFNAPGIDLEEFKQFIEFIHKMRRLRLFYIFIRKKAESEEQEQIDFEKQGVLMETFQPYRVKDVKDVNIYVNNVPLL